MKKLWSLILLLVLTGLAYADITPLPDPPSRAVPSTFAAKADAFLGALPTFATEANQLALDVNSDAAAAAVSAASAMGYSNIALSAANFAGDWEDQAGAAAPPYAVWHAGNYWQLVNAVLDVSATEPGQTTDWRVIGDKITVSTIADLRLISGVGVSTAYLIGHTSPDDGGQGVFYWDTDSVLTDNGGTIVQVTGVTTGRWVRQYDYLTPDMFGAFGNGGALTNSHAAFQSMAAAGTNGCKFVIPAKTYYINGDVEFDIYNYTIEMYGATIIQSGTNNTTFVLNKSALPDESVIRANIQVRGGWMANSTGYAANTNTAISTRGAFACNIKDVRFIDFGEEAILVGVRDSLWITECSFYNNYRHIYKDEWITAAGNPQLIYVDKCVTSISGAESILIAGCANEVNIKNTSFIGSDSIVMHTGSAGTASLSCNIDSCSFEQGTAGGYYVRTQYENTKILRNLNILNSTFQDSTPHAIQLEAVNQAIIQGCKFNSDVDGVIDIDANCLNINFGPNEWPNINSYAQGITYACARSAINFYPAETIVTPIALAGYTGAAMSTGTGTLDMSGLIGAYWNTAGRLIPPKAWILKVRARDTGSSASVSTVLLRDVVGTSINEAQGLYLQGTTNNVYRTGTFIIPCDPNGDLFYDVTASGTGTLELRLSVIGYVR